MRLAPLLAVGFAVCAIAAPIPKEQPAAKVPNYFPCALGTKWEYESGKDPIVVEVTRVRHEPDCKVVTFTHTWPAKSASIDLRYRVTKDAVYAFEKDGKVEVEMLVLKPAAKPGDEWVNVLPGHFADGATTTVREPTKVEVPAGKFDVIGTSVTLKGVPADLLQLTNFYAEGIGRVMSPGAKLGQPAMVLNKFTPPPK